MKPVHFVSISGGKDSTATMCLAIERAQRRSMNVRFIFADTGNEHPITLAHVDYLADRLGVTIETVRADFTAKFPARREAMRRDWVKELRRKQHSRSCLAACKDLKYAEKAFIREECECPVKVTPPLPIELVERAIALMQPTGNPFLDMGMLHGRFPGSQTRFCTDELKLQPMAELKEPLRFAGTPTIEWIGERADESEARAAKPALELIRCAIMAPTVLYRPIHQWKAEDTFEIARRHGLKPNPLYQMGMSRVGCMPCIMCKKGELREIARRFPEQIDRIEEWESIVGGVARHAYTSLIRKEREEMISSFLPTDKVPADENGMIRASIRRAVEWSRTGRGGRNFDIFSVIGDASFAEEPSRCQSQYAVCE
ncbi:phosphoadenosine phosphosulfate reductase domain-containing protein [Novosphingobium gossypii]|uniref:phosphoadenosine phosphosulfate reductase domain-containing protein n=1 Tax=Novosphingobium gossypii TaxID=1604774 RepID=UPI003D1FE3BA